ncbi:signal peptidase I [Rubrobacter marinus]|uniref:Signal peptidase I n=2 Tax=Rubrobacter marinus TaxID=2653852 RepID=A0A6G8Q2A6_9ACTN|nr:signal peptidase I [Rubrobacter marinus]
MLVVAFNLVFGVVRPFVAEPMRVPSKSMAPTLQPKDRMLTNKLAYDLTNPDRGDLVVFKGVEKKGKGERLVKRVVGLPGDVVHVDRGVLKVNGEPQNEPYLSKDDRGGGEGRDGARRKAPPGVNSFGPMFVPEDHVFVLGDNRANSHDSRYFGPVPTENLIGEPSLRFWPLNRLGTP